MPRKIDLIGCLVPFEKNTRLAGLQTAIYSDTLSIVPILYTISARTAYSKFFG